MALFSECEGYRVLASLSANRKHDSQCYLDCLLKDVDNALRRKFRKSLSFSLNETKILILRLHGND